MSYARFQERHLTRLASLDLPADCESPQGARNPLVLDQHPRFDVAGAQVG